MAKASASYAASLQKDIRQANLSFGDLAKIMPKVRELPLQDDDLNSLMVAVAEPPGGSGPLTSGSGRQQLQRYEAFVNYLPQHLWNSLKSNQAIAMEKLVKHMVALGLRNPTEPTMQKLTAILVLCTEGEAGARTLPPMSGNEILRMFKKQLKAQCKRDPLAYIVELPASAEDFRRQWPAMYSAVFAESAGPVSCPYGADVVSTVMDGIPMRSSRRSGAGVVAPVGGCHFAEQLVGLMGQLLQQPRMSQSSGSSAPMLQIFSQPQRNPLSTPLALEDGVARASPQLSPDPRLSPQPKPETKLPIEVPKPAPVQEAMPEEPKLPAVQSSRLKVERKSVADASFAILQAMESKANPSVLKRPAAALKTPATKKQKAEPVGQRPCFGVERSRQQVMCRTGLKGSGQHFAISFKKAGSEKAAIEQAKVWLQKELVKRGFA